MCVGHLFTKETAQELFDAIRNHAELHMTDIMSGDVPGTKLYTGAAWSNFHEIKQSISTAKINHTNHQPTWKTHIIYSLIDHFILAQERPVIFWSERDKEVVTENDLVNNFDILKEYLWCVGGATPLPHMLHHEVGGGLHWFPIHLHVVDGLSTDDALCRISCPWLQNQYIWLLRQCSDASVQLRKLVLQFGHLCSEHDPTLDFGNMLSCPSAPWACSRMQILLLGKCSNKYLVLNPMAIVCLQAAFILLSVTYNLHSGVYNVRGGRGLIKDSCVGFQWISSLMMSSTNNLIIRIHYIIY